MVRPQLLPLQPHPDYRDPFKRARHYQIDLITPVLQPTIPKDTASASRVEYSLNFMSISLHVGYYQLFISTRL